MRISRYLELQAFCDEASKLKAVSHHLSTRELERLERQRSLIPRLRLHYPETIGRRWFAASKPSIVVGGPQEPDGPRWQDACDLEEARNYSRWQADPTQVPHPLDDPEARFLPFIEIPTEQPFVPWDDYRVMIDADDKESIYDSSTIVTYYSSWQLLQFCEIINMGINIYMNLFEFDGWPTDEQIAAAPRSMSFLPMHAMRGFTKHAATLDAVVWFAEEANNGFSYARRKEYRRRLRTEEEHDEIMRTRLWAAEEARRRHKIDPEHLLEAIRFLCGQWAEWEGNGRPLIANAYKIIAAEAVRFACLTSGVTVDEYRNTVGHVGPYFKPILDVIWPDWAREQRNKARCLLAGYRHPTSLLQANFNDKLIDRFLDFIDKEGLHSFYWRLESFHRHAFNSNDYSLGGLKSDVQGMGVVLEHIASALGGSRLQLRDKFKQLWAGEPEILKLLKDNSIMKVGQGKTIDLECFARLNAQGLFKQTAADLAICYAIRGGAHHVIEETNPLKLELMMLIMLRAAVKTFDAARPQSSCFE